MNKNVHVELLHAISLQSNSGNHLEIASLHHIELSFMSVTK